MHMFAKKFWGGVPAKEEEDDGGQAGRSGNLLSGEKKLNKATRDVLGNKLRGMKASKDTEKEMSTRNFSPAFLKMAERNFYLFATKTKQGKYMLNSRELPGLLYVLKQPDWFIEVVEQEVRDSRREYLSYEELLIVLNYKTDLSRDDILESFITFDQDGSGQLSKTELRKVLCDQGKYRFSAEEFDRLFKMVDSDNSGSISLDEFIRMWIIGKEELK